jgi:HPt (histidine-containing phosphotransfer) domain-containing protein
MFLEDTLSRFAALHEAIANGDAGEAETVSHVLKGSASNMGAARLAEVCGHLEGLGGSGDLAGAEELILRAEAEFAEARSALEVELG